MYCYANLRFLNRIEAEDAGQSLAEWMDKYADQVLPPEEHQTAEQQQLAAMDAAAVIEKVKANEAGEMLDVMQV